MLPVIHKPTLHQISFSNPSWTGEALYLYATASLGDSWVLDVNAAFDPADARAGTNLVAHAYGQDASAGTLSFTQVNSSGISFTLDFSGADLSLLSQKHEAVIEYGLVTQQLVSNLSVSGGRGRTFYVRPYVSDDYAFSASTVAPIPNEGGFNLNTKADGHSGTVNGDWVLEGDGVRIAFTLSGFLDGSNYLGKYFRISSGAGSEFADNIDEVIGAINDAAEGGRIPNAVFLEADATTSLAYNTSYFTTSTILGEPDVVTVDMDGASNTNQYLYIDPTLLASGKRFQVKVVNAGSYPLRLTATSGSFRVGSTGGSTLSLPYALDGAVVYGVEIVVNKASGTYLDVVAVAAQS